MSEFNFVEIKNEPYDEGYLLNEATRNCSDKTQEELGNEASVESSLVSADNYVHSIFGADTPDWTQASVNTDKEVPVQVQLTESSTECEKIIFNKEHHKEINNSPSTYGSAQHQKPYDHQNTLTKPKINCPQCFFTTINRGNLKQHMKKHERPEKRVHKCTDCSFQTKYKNSIKSHVLRHRLEVMAPYIKKTLEKKKC